MVHNLTLGDRSMELVNTFVSPTKQVALNGELGLSAGDVAKSLGARSTNVRKKLKSMIPRMKKLGFGQAEISAHTSKNIKYQEHILSVEAARFFVGKYENEIGDAYLAYLLKCENFVSDIETAAQNDPIIQGSLQLIKLRMEQQKQEQRLQTVETEMEKVNNNIRALNPCTGYRTIKGHCNLSGISLPLKRSQFIGKAATTYCKENNIIIGKVPCERFGQTNSYPIEVLKMLIKD